MIAEMSSNQMRRSLSTVSRTNLEVMSTYRPICNTYVGYQIMHCCTSLCHCRQCSIVLKPRSDRIDYTVVCFATHDCSRKLREDSTTDASWVWGLSWNTETAVVATDTPLWTVLYTYAATRCKYSSLTVNTTGDILDTSTVRVTS